MILWLYQWKKSPVRFHKIGGPPLAIVFRLINVGTSGQTFITCVKATYRCSFGL